MIKVELSLAEQPFTLMIAEQQVVKIFHDQQAIAFENPRENYVEFMLDEQLIGIDSSEVSQQSLALYVNNQFATQLALPAAAQGEPKKGFLGLAALGFKLFKSGASLGEAR